MHTLALVLVLVAIFGLPVYLLSGLFGPRQPEDVNLNAPEPTEEEFNQE